MKTLEDHTILYDDECPMCSKYTQAFVKTGMLDDHGRQAFTEAHACDLPHIDWNRARNEIAVINKRDNTVQYGVDGLMKILVYNAAWLKPLFSFKPFQFLVRGLYFFISYNRKVIAPGKVFEGMNVCTPEFELYISLGLHSVCLACNFHHASLLFHVVGASYSADELHQRVPDMWWSNRLSRSNYPFCEKETMHTLPGKHDDHFPCWCIVTHTDVLN